MQDESLMTETEFYAKLIAPLKQAEEGKVLESAQEFKSLLGL
jgi:hypothetical protein